MEAFFGDDDSIISNRGRRLSPPSRPLGAPPTAKRGELLIYRPRAEAETATRTTDVPAPESTTAPDKKIVVVYGGRNFVATPDMAACFLRHARRIVTSHESGLAVLLHSGGVELLFIADTIPFTVGDMWDHRPGGHQIDDTGLVRRLL